MWFKVTGRNGAIVSCDFVETAYADGKNVLYVDAASKSEACAMALQIWADRHRALRREATARRAEKKGLKRPGSRTGGTVKRLDPAELHRRVTERTAAQGNVYARYKAKAAHDELVAALAAYDASRSTFRTWLTARIRILAAAFEKPKAAS
jgi:hypothetical protein